MVTRVISGTTYTLVYDAEGRMTGFSGGGVTASFGYDGDGQRITGTVGAVTTAYIGGHYEWLGTCGDRQQAILLCWPAPGGVAVQGHRNQPRSPAPMLIVNTGRRNTRCRDTAALR